MRATIPSFVVAALATLGGGEAIAAPAQLYGKSVVVTWSENRQQKAAHDTTLHSVQRNGEFSVYISSAGRAFNRMTYSGSGMGRGRGGRSRSGSSEQVGGEGQGQSRNVGFSGRTMTTTTPLEGGARRILVTFDNDFSGCNAQVLTGKAGGATKINSRSMMNADMPIEIHSVETGAASCKVQSGNVFGN